MTTTPFPSRMPVEKPTDRPLSAAMQRMYDVWNPLQDRGNEFFSNFKYTPLEGFPRDSNISRRDPSKLIRIGGTYYVSTQVPPVAPGPFVPDVFADNGDGRGITWGLCHINPDGGGPVNESILARFDCDLSRHVDRPPFKRNNLRFEEHTYFQRVCALPQYLRDQIEAEQGHVDRDTVLRGPAR